MIANYVQHRKDVVIFLKDADDSEEEEKENKNNVATEQLGR